MAAVTARVGGDRTTVFSTIHFERVRRGRSAASSQAVERRAKPCPVGVERVFVKVVAPRRSSLTR